MTFSYRLLESGYSIYDILESSLEANKERNLRIESIKHRKWDGINEAIEKTTRTLKKAARRSSLLGSRGGGSEKSDSYKSYELANRILQKEQQQGNLLVSTSKDPARPNIEGATTA